MAKDGGKCIFLDLKNYPRANDFLAPELQKNTLGASSEYSVASHCLASDERESTRQRPDLRPEHCCVWWCAGVFGVALASRTVPRARPARPYARSERSPMLLGWPRSRDANGSGQSSANICVHTCRCASRSACGVRPKSRPANFFDTFRPLPK